MENSAKNHLKIISSETAGPTMVEWSSDGPL
jgi:hypothetical protein